MKTCLMMRKTQMSDEDQTVYDGDTSDWTDSERASLEVIQRHRVDRITITERDDFHDVLVELYFPGNGMSQATGTTRQEALGNAETAALAWDRATADAAQQADAGGLSEGQEQELPTEEEFAKDLEEGA